MYIRHLRNRSFARLRHSKHLLAELDLEGARLDALCTPAAFTATAATDVLNDVAHGLLDGQGPLLVESTTTLPAGLAADTLYFVRDKADDTFKVAIAVGGTAVAIDDAGTGTHTYKPAVANREGLWDFIRRGNTDMLRAVTDQDELVGAAAIF